MPERSDEEKRKILKFLAESLSFAKTLEAFPSLSIPQLREILRGQTYSSALSPDKVVREWPGKPDALLIHIDGASRGNPGKAGIGVLIQDSQGETISRVSKPIGETTNNVAEYRALLEALNEAERRGARDLTILSDSQLLVNQINGTYRVRDPGILTLWSQAKRKLIKFEKYRVLHIARNQNKQADALANAAIDSLEETT